MNAAAASIIFLYLHDNHTSTRLYGATLDEVLAHADAVESKNPDGMLCPVYLMRGDKEVRRVGRGAHSSCGKRRWIAGKAAWRNAVEDDPDVMRLLPFNNSHQPERKLKC